MCYRLFFLCLLVISPLFSEGHSLAVGPEGSYMERKRKGGSKQTGDLWGGHLLYQRECTNGLYWAIEGYLITGNLHGHTGGGTPLHSTKTDREIEGAIGYMWQPKWLPRLALTPFGGYGHFHGNNRFHAPSPLPIKIRNTFNYWLGGLRVQWQFSNCIKAGIRFKGKWMEEAQSTVFGDPNPAYSKVNMQIEDKICYEVDLPIECRVCCRGKSLALSFAPFYRFRHYGGRENVPCDFIETEFQLYGAKILFSLVL